MSRSPEPPSALLARAEQGDRRALSRLISGAERGEPLPGIPLDGRRDADRLCLGITGAPGAGKSTLVSTLVEELLKSSESAAVLAVDPSSPLSRGALLGDRVRMHRHATAANVFIRSMASRSHHGGLAAATQASRRLLQHCGWPLVLIETVGVGQVELDIVNTADLAIVVLNPGWGDEIQANKAGLMEIADIFVINKADRPGLASTRRDLDAVIMARPEGLRPPVVETVASEGEGTAALAAAIEETHRRLGESGELVRRRRGQLQRELVQQVDSRFAAALADFEATPVFAMLVEQAASGERSIASAAEASMAKLLDGFSGPRSAGPPQPSATAEQRPEHGEHGNHD